MENAFDGLVIFIKTFFGILTTSQSALHEFLTDVVIDHPNISAYFVELALIAIPIMARLLYVRKKQRMIPGPKPEVIVSPVPTPPALPDRTVSIETGRAVLIFIAVLLVFAIISML